MNRLQVSPVSRLLRSHRGVFPYWLHWSEESAVSRAASSPVLGWQTQLLSHWQRRVPAHGLKGLLLGFVYSIKRRLHGEWKLSRSLWAAVRGTCSRALQPLASVGGITWAPPPWETESGRDWWLGRHLPWAQF